MHDEALFALVLEKHGIVNEHAATRILALPAGELVERRDRDDKAAAKRQPKRITTIMLNRAARTAHRHPRVVLALIATLATATLALPVIGITAVVVSPTVLKSCLLCALVLVALLVIMPDERKF
jgi:hypothetical protein